MKMTAERLQLVVEQLPSYADYQQAQATVSANHRRSFNADSISDLETRTRYLRAKSALAPLATALQVEVAQSRPTIPLAYQLGLLQAIDKPVPKLSYPESFAMIASNLPHGFNNDVTLEDFQWPSSNPFEQATRIGDVILRVGNIVRPGRQVLMALLTTKYDSYSHNHLTEVECYVSKKDGFVVEEPKIVESDHGQAVTYRLPAISAKKINFHPAHAVILPRSQDGKAKTVQIPELQQLSGDGYAVAKLIFGRAKVTKLALRLNSEREEYARNRRDFEDFMRRPLGSRR